MSEKSSLVTKDNVYLMGFSAPVFIELLVCLVSRDFPGAPLRAWKEDAKCGELILETGTG